jgi:hypothetical protein
MAAAAAFIVLTGCNVVPGTMTDMVDGGTVGQDATVITTTVTQVQLPTGELGVLNGYSHRRTITVSGSSVNSDLFSITVPILIDQPEIFEHCRPDGRDLAVTLLDGTTALNREVAYFDAANKKAMIWVKLPWIFAGTDQQLYLYYGNPNIDVYPDNPNVWAGTYAAVWHLDQVSDPIRDATWNRNDGITENLGGSATSTLGVDGKVGRAIEFSADQDNRILISRNDPSFFTDYVTITAWVRWRDDMASGIGRIFDRTREDNGFVSIYSLMVDNTTGVASAEFYTDQGSYGTLTSSVPLSADQWHHLTFVHGITESKLFVDGVSVATSTQATGASLSLSSPGRSVMAIGNQGGRSRPFNGTIDEVKITRDARNDSWVKFRSNVERDPKNIVQISDTAEEFCPSPYRYFTEDRTMCEWSCGEGTVPSEAAGTCVCQEDYAPEGVDSFGRLVCAETTMACPEDIPSNTPGHGPGFSVGNFEYPGYVHSSVNYRMQNITYELVTTVSPNGHTTITCRVYRDQYDRWIGYPGESVSTTDGDINYPANDGFGITCTSNGATFISKGLVLGSYYDASKCYETAEGSRQWGFVQVIIDRTAGTMRFIERCTYYEENEWGDGFVTVNRDRDISGNLICGY